MKIQSQNMHFSYFFRSGRPNRKKAVKMTSQTPSGTLQAGPREGEIDQLFAPRASQGRQQQFLGRPVPSQSLSGTAPGRRWKQGRRPRAAQRPPGSHFGAILALFWSIFASIFDHPAPHFHTFPVTCFRHVCSLCFSFFSCAPRKKQSNRSA